MVSTICISPLEIWFDYSNACQISFKYTHFIRVTPHWGRFGFDPNCPTDIALVSDISVILFSVPIFMRLFIHSLASRLRSFSKRDSTRLFSYNSIVSWITWSKYGGITWSIVEIPHHLEHYVQFVVMKWGNATSYFLFSASFWVCGKRWC